MSLLAEKVIGATLILFVPFIIGKFDQDMVDSRLKSKNLKIPNFGTSKWFFLQSESNKNDDLVVFDALGVT